MLPVTINTHASKLRSFAASLLFTTASISVTTVVTVSEVHAQTLQTYNIPAGSLATALNRFSEVSNIQLVYDASLTRNLQSPGIKGTMLPAEALSHLLSGSGLLYKFTNGKSVTLTKPSNTITLGPVRVGGVLQKQAPDTAMIGNLPPVLPGGEVARGGQMGMLGNKDVMDTPFNATSYTADFIKNRQIRNIRDALKDDPSVRSTFTTGSPGYEAMTVRGFNVLSTDMSFGGLYGIVPAPATLSEVAERVEVLKGPAALLNGMSPGGSIGGSINIVPKRAHDTPLTEVEADYTSNSQFGGHLDLGRRFGKNKNFGLRANGVIRSGDTAIERNSMRTALTSLGADARFKHVRLSADFGYQYRGIDGTVPYFSLQDTTPIPQADKVSRNLGAPWSRDRSQDYFGIFKSEVDLLRNVTAYGAVGMSSNQAHSLMIKSISNIDSRGLGNGSANATGNESTNITADLGLRAHIKTAFLLHELAFAANRYQSDSGTFSQYETMNRGTVPIDGYTAFARPTIKVPGHVPHTASSTLSSLAFADTISALDKRIQVTAGLRVQRVQSANFSALTGLRTSSYDQTAISPAVMAVFKPVKNVMVYGNWIQGLQQGTIVGSTYANAGEIFSPYKSTQYEVGVKGDFGRFVATFDVFQIMQPSTIYDSATNILSLNGEQRNRGLELNVVGQLAKGLHIAGGLMLIDPRLTKTQGGKSDGWKAAGVSTVNFNVGLNYDIPWVKNLALTSDVTYTSSQYLDTIVPRRSFPGWVRLDLGARYSIKNPASQDGGRLSFYLNVDNVANTRYWNSMGPYAAYFLTLGAPRTVRFAISADF